MKKPHVLQLFASLLSMYLIGCRVDHSAEKDYERVYNHIKSRTKKPSKYHAGSMFFLPNFKKRKSDSVWVIHQYSIKTPGALNQEKIDTFVVDGYGRVTRLDRK